MASGPKQMTLQTLGKLEVQRLGKNINGYFGETIDIGRILEDTVQAARHYGWAVEELPATAGSRILALKRTQNASLADSRRRVYLSTGIHGDEPAGPLAVLQLLQENEWPENCDLWLCPCLNPEGFRLNKRENPLGLDLNRQYLNPVAAETLAHTRWLEQQPAFDLCLCLHEDWESHGFYVYELNPDDRPSLAPEMIARVAEVCPIDLSELIEGRAARGGIIRPSIDPRERPQWPESFYLLTHKTRLSYTLEAPSDFPLLIRAASLVAAVRAALKMAAG